MSKIWPVVLRYFFLVGLLVLAAATLLTGSTSRRASATTGPKFSVHIHGNPCDPYYGMNPCNIYPGSVFTVDVTIDKLNLPDWDGDTIGKYKGFQARVTSSLLPYQNRPEQAELTGVWPDCVYAIDDPSSPSTYVGGCLVSGSSAGSSYLGVVMQVDFLCNTNPTEFPTISLVYGSSDDTVIFDENYNIVTPESPASTLTVRCHWLGLPPTSTWTPTPTRTSTPTPTVAGVGGVAELASSGALLARDHSSGSGGRYVWAGALLAGVLFLCASGVLGVRLLKRA